MVPIFSISFETSLIHFSSLQVQVFLSLFLLFHTQLCLLNWLELAFEIQYSFLYIKRNFYIFLWVMLFDNINIIRIAPFYHILNIFLEEMISNNYEIPLFSLEMQFVTDIKLCNIILVYSFNSNSEK